MTDYHSIITTYRTALPPGRLLEMPLMGMDRIGVPFWMLTFYPDGGPTNAGSGYGMADEEALVGAFGELTEVVSCNRAMRRMPRERGSFHQMRNRHGPESVVDPVTLCLEAGSAYSPDQPLQWVPTRRYTTGETVWVPLEFVACQPSDVEGNSWLITLITNGLGAGLDYDQAVAHGLLELLQRDGDSVTFRVLADAVALDLTDVQDEHTWALLHHLDEQGIEVIAKVASTDFGIPNIYVVGMDREPTAQSPIMSMACGEAAHPNRERALRKALLEFAAARSRLGFSHGPLAAVEANTPPGYLAGHTANYNPATDEQRALDAMCRLTRMSLEEMRALLGQRVHAVRATCPFNALPSNEVGSNPGELAQFVVGRLAAEGFDVLVADFSPPDKPVYAVKVIVPGLEVETMSYHRIGLRNLRRLMARNEGLAGIGAPPPGAAPIHLTAAAQEELGGPAWLNIATIERLVGPLYGLYREPARHAAALINEGRLSRTV
ncbi:MAG: YcaO-like family protein [Chloroflexaceae bacterium]|jgi:ribosomal protein S12 methylthiotransferase accessory factor|nr:YcaO-like family protein [Chloroflexaceae bacterium]